MRTSFLLPVAIVVLALAGFGCAKQQLPAAAPETAPEANTAATTTPTATEATSTPAAKPTAPAAAPKPSATNVKKNFYVEMDDSGAYPKSGTAAKNAMVTVTFKIRATNVFYNGLVVKSNKHDLGKIQGGQSKTITFTANEDITFVGQWPNGTAKSRWTLIVK